ncbi:hypothetical protein ACIGO9_30155 [Nocardia asteroides]|uniref:hypothetical protein n=1 Tax=Nocardia asteroides TaxID=1824 RepID=UPI0037C78A41
MSSEQVSLARQADFEAARDVLAGLIGYGSAHDDPAWAQRIRDWADRRNRLRPNDAAAVATVLDVDAAELAALRRS